MWYAYLMETFVLIILAVLAAIVIFWLIVWPALLLLGAGFTVAAGAIKGGRSR
jgi:nitrogen fixation/metabolism regulation signal transduction histidine kinase